MISNKEIFLPLSKDISHHASPLLVFRKHQREETLIKAQPAEPTSVTTAPPTTSTTTPIPTTAPSKNIKKKFGDFFAFKKVRAGRGAKGDGVPEGKVKKTSIADLIRPLPGGSTCRERARKGKGKRKGEGTREGERKGEGQRETGWGKHSQGSHNHGHHHHPHHHRFNNNCTSYWGQNVTQSSFTCPHTCTDPTCIHSHTSCLLSEQNRRGPSTVPCCTSPPTKTPSPVPVCVHPQSGRRAGPWRRAAPQMESGGLNPSVALSERANHSPSSCSQMSCQSRMAQPRK